MESMIHRMKSKGTTLDTDASSATRLSQRPKSSGVTFEDFGTSFGKISSRTSAASTSRRPSKKPGPSSKGVVIEFMSDAESSEDEINFLSGSSRHGSESPKKPKKTGKRATSIARSIEASPSPTVSLVIDRHQADPNYKPIDFSKMSFRKTKKLDASASNQTPGSSQESRSKDYDIGSSSSRPARSLSRPNNPVDLPNAPEKRKALPLRERTPNQDRPRSRRPSPPPPQEKGVARKEQDKDADKTPRASRVVPRPVNKGNRSSLGKSQTVPDLRPGSQEKGWERSQPLSRSQSTHELAGTHSAPIQVSDDDSDGVKTDLPRRKANGKARDTGNGRQGPATRADRDIISFPDLSPLSSQVAVRERTRDKGKGKAREDPIGARLNSPSFRKRNKHDLATFPMLSPLSSPASRSGSSPPPSSSSMTRNKLPGKRKNVVVSSEEEEEDERQLAPFPMATQDLESLRRASPAVKRTTPEGGLEGESGTYKKKRRRDSEKFSLDFDSDSDDDMFFNPAIDPKTLCPWCDEPLPSEPTPHLRALMTAAKRVSSRDDRLTNPLGLRAPLTAFVGVCQRHRFERNWVPRARKRGWPTTIDWDALSGRISRLRRHLQAIVNDVDEEFAPNVPRSGTSGSMRPRKENEFWVEAVKNVRQQGSRQTTGVRGQFQHFNKTQPGYYGELGYVIIHQTLCDMFPPADFHPDATLPLTPPDFITLVLVPEAALRLITEDLSLPRDEAIETLRESVEYGVAMFPADEDEGQGTHGNANGAGEQMFMERARARRKELEEEERLEEEEEAARRAARPKPRPRPRTKAKALECDGAQTDDESIGRASSPPSASKSKRKAPSRASSRARSTSGEPGESVIILTSDAGESDAGSGGPTKRRRKARGTARVKTSDVEMDAVEATPKPISKPRPRPRPVAPAVFRQDAEEDEQRLDAEKPRIASSSSTARYCVRLVEPQWKDPNHEGGHRDYYRDDA
ncbi:RTC4-like domain-containing protein [Ganoderma leucocontextum]|nr:RTC4-like domain-containing protein [Ganoderma leucocontextum]